MKELPLAEPQIEITNVYTRPNSYLSDCEARVCPYQGNRICLTPPDWCNDERCPLWEIRNAG